MPLTFNEEHELVVLEALTKHNLAMVDKIGEYERYPDHCEFWIKQKKKAQSALDATERYFRAKGK